MLYPIKTHINSLADDYRFTVIIPSWNNLEYLKLCLNSIKEHSALNIQIIVLVNEGKDNTADWLMTQGDIDLIHSTSNLGICYGLNLCRPLVKAPYIIYLNDDMYVLPNWDIELDKNIQSIGHNDFMMSATMIEPYDTGNSCVVVKDFGDDLSSFRQELLLKEYESLKREHWNGSTWPPSLIPTKLWDLIGGYSVEFSPGMYSDPDISKKIYDAGVRTFIGIGTSLVYHFGSKSTGRVKTNPGRTRFLMKWGMSANFFMNKVLQVGKPFCELPQVRPLSNSERIMQKLKQIKEVIKR